MLVACIFIIMTAVNKSNALTEKPVAVEACYLLQALVKCVDVRGLSINTWDFWFYKMERIYITIVLRLCF